MKKITLLFAFLIISCKVLLAVPAYPYPITFTQPNGDTLTIRILGDERMNWRESMDGYTLLFNEAGYLTYAQLDEYGNMQPSDFIASNITQRNAGIRSFLNTVEKNLSFSDAQKQLMLQVWKIEDDAQLSITRGVTGQYKTLCAFVQFPGKSMITPMSQFENLMNQLGYTGNGSGSVRDFFRESSYGQFDLIITLCGVYTAPNNESYYAGADGSGPNCRQLATWAAQQVAAESHIDFSDYDSNNDGYVDGFHFIFAGRGQEAGGGAGTIWSHKWSLSSTVTKNGKSITIYSCSPELYYSSITTIGVICHEMTHAFGECDFYDTNQGTGGQYEGTGRWDIMASGSWNGSPGGNTPPHHNIYTKIKFGWVTPTVLTQPAAIQNMPNAAEEPVAYRINTTTANEYFLLENRQQVKFDAGIPGNGLIIYRVHSNIAATENTNTVNATHQQRMYPVAANAPQQIPAAGAANYGNINSTSCSWPTSTKNQFTDATTPSMRSWANANTGKPITNITQSNRLISFNFMGGDLPIQYTLTFDPLGGTVNPISQPVAYNTQIGTLPTPTLPGCQFLGWFIDNTQISSTTLWTWPSNKTATARWNYGITAVNNNPALGTITLPGTTYYSLNDDVTFTITPNAGNHITTVVVDGVVKFTGEDEVTEETTYTFENINHAHTITVGFARNCYAPNIGNTGDATVTISPEGCIQHGQTVTFNVSADCYRYEVIIGGTNHGTFNVETHNESFTHTITANGPLPLITVNTTPIIYTITATPTEENDPMGHITPSGIATVNCEEDITFNFFPASGHVVESVFIDNIPIPVSPTLQNYTFTNVTANHEIHVTFKAFPTAIIQGPTEVCHATNPEQLTAVVTPANANITYVWTEDDIIVGSGATQTVNNTVRANPYIYVVKITYIESGYTIESAPHAVTVHPVYTTPVSVSICEGETYDFFGAQLTATDVYTHTLQTVNGCDSVIQLSLTVNPTYWVQISDTIHVGETYDFFGEILDESGIFTHKLLTIHDCDSIIELTLTVNEVGIHTLTLPDIKIYPNPTNGKLIVESGEWKMESVEIFDTYGRKINFQSSIINQQFTINLSHLPAGIYFLKIATHAGKVVKKVIKE